jgi:histidinol-phosphate aminotransferase
MDEFIDRLPGGTILVLDEAYCEYVTSDDYPDGIEYIRQGKDVIVLRTFSKVYGLAGLRIGYGISSEEIIDMIQRVKEPFNVNSIAQAGALESLKDEIQITRSREMVEKGKKYLYHALTHMGLTYVPTEANFLLINVNRDSQEVFQELLKRGVIIRTGDIFGLPDYIRVTIGTMEQNERFISALKEVLLKLTNSAQKRASS